MATAGRPSTTHSSVTSDRTSVTDNQTARGPTALEGPMGHRDPRLPSVTVVIPARNSAATLGAQLDALSTQTYAGPVEVIVVDNGSVDGTRDLVEARVDPAGALRVVTADGGVGAAFARNAGARLAAGELLAFCDADDVVDARWLAGLVAAARQHDAVTGPLRFAASLNATDVLHRYGHRPDQLSASVLLEVNDFMPYGTSANLAVWRAVYDELGGFDEACLTVEDKEFSWRLQLAGYRLGFAADAIVDYRLRPSVRGLARQQYVYGKNEVGLYPRFEAMGMPRRRPWVVAKSWARLGVGMLKMFDPKSRAEVQRLVPRYAGRVVGSLAFRTRYL
jgi:GT2 family glycosyltransferase